MPAFDGVLLPVVSSTAMATPSDLDPLELVPRDLEKDLFENTNNSCPSTLDLGGMFPD
jgi:hypothetical protein